MPAVKYTPHDERAISVEACCDPRTVRAYLSGAQTRSTTAARIKAALLKLKPVPVTREPKAEVRH